MDTVALSAAVRPYRIMNVELGAYRLPLRHRIVLFHCHTFGQTLEMFRSRPRMAEQITAGKNASFSGGPSLVR